MILADLVQSWREEADLFRRRGLTAYADLVDSYADQLEAGLRRAVHETVTYQQAAEISGYTADHIGRLVREGHIENVGRKHAPRVRIMDLPRKPGCAIGGHETTVLQLEHGRLGGLEEGRSDRRLRVQSGGDAS